MLILGLPGAGKSALLKLFSVAGQLRVLYSEQGFPFEELTIEVLNLYLLPYLLQPALNSLSKFA